MKHTGDLIVTTPNDREITLTRVFDAPRQRVFEAYTTPAQLERWLGVFDGSTFEVCEVDLRVGGSYRYVWRDRHGKAMGMRGVFREIVKPERIVATEVFDEPWYEGGAEDTIEFTEADRRTTLNVTVRYASEEVRDGVLRTPMTDGVSASYDELEKILDSRRG